MTFKKKIRHPILKNKSNFMTICENLITSRNKYRKKVFECSETSHIINLNYL